jgi:quinol monooxygenase YgiN
LSVHFFVVLEPLPGNETSFRQELQLVVPPTLAERGCQAINVFESLRSPTIFTIHSEWVDEAAFEQHAQLPHTVRFMESASVMLTHPLLGLRTRHLTGGPGAALSASFM